MLNELNLLKKKIEVFELKFYSKDQPIKYEENKFDKFIGILFSYAINYFKFSFKFITNIVLRMINKILNLITQQENLKNKILEQEKILIKNVELNEKLSNQILLLNDKIEKLVVKNTINSLTQNDNFSIVIKESDKASLDEDKKLNFMQEENLRISNELFESNKKMEILKNEIEKYHNQRSDLINKINSVNEIVNDSNVLTNVFDNNISDTKIEVKDPKKIKKPNINLDEQVSNIFAKR